MRSPGSVASAIVPLVALLMSGACDRATDPVQPATPSFGHGTTDLSTTARKGLAELRRTVAPFNNFEKGSAAGWDTPITTCWFHSQLGAMGYHYAKLSLIEDGVISLVEPELLVYQPERNGRLRLVAVEYIVPVALWQGASPPALFGMQFHQTPDGALWILHVWTGLHNPAGTFEDWNPNATCEFADEADDLA